MQDLFYINAGIIPQLPRISLGIGAEILYSFVVIFCSLMIYFGTRELYRLSSYKGLKYFRLAFLFFAVAYFFRLAIEFMVATFNVEEIFEIYPLIISYVSLLVFIYFSSMSIFYLIYSVLWKNLKNNSKIIYLFHAIAISMAFSTIAFNNVIFYLGLNLVLFVFAGVFIYLSSHSPKFKSRKNRFDKVYILLLVFFILNIINILVPKFLEALKILLYLALLSIFFIILYKVLKKSGD